MIFSGTKDGNNYGFYLEKDDLQNCVELTNADHMVLIDGQSAGKMIVWDENGVPSLANPPEPTEAEHAAQARSRRDKLIEAMEWRIERYRQQTVLGKETSDSSVWYEKTLLYVQQLRDIPNQTEFPYQIAWPVKPEA